MAPKKVTTSQPSSATQQAERQQVPEQGKAPRQEHVGRSVPVPVPEMHVRRVPVQIPDVKVPMPGAVRDRLPEVTPGRVFWWGGLAALAATELISWPVAGVVAVGVYVAERSARAAQPAPPTEEAHGGSQDTSSSHRE